MNGGRLSIAQFTLTVCVYGHGCMCVAKVGKMPACQKQDLTEIWKNCLLFKSLERKGPLVMHVMLS